MRKLVISCIAAAAAFAAACEKSTSTTAPSSALAVSMASAFSTTPAGFDELSTSFDASGSGGAFAPGFDDHGRGPRGFGPPGIGPGFGLGFMGGGLGAPFLGDGPGRFHDDDNCAFSTSAGYTCADTTRSGVIGTRVETYTTLAGVVEKRIGPSTNTVSTSTTLVGTVTRRDSSTSSVNEASRQTVSGLASGSTSRTIDGASKGIESSTGTSSQGAFTAMRVVGDTIKGIVIPVAPTKGFPYPTAGTIIRVMNASVTITGQAAATSSRREVITYDGSATAKVVITQDATTQNCTLPLPHGRLNCS